SKTDFSRKREKDSKHSDLNHIVFEWFSSVRAENIPISGPILQEKAKDMAEIHKIDCFSNGWLQSFRKRHGIIFNVSRGESNVQDQLYHLIHIYIQYVKLNYRKLMLQHLMPIWTTIGNFDQFNQVEPLGSVFITVEIRYIYDGGDSREVDAYIREVDRV
ncbi:hypothetical protein J437_LFUL005737, partial [Ladona fulva]